MLNGFEYKEHHHEFALEPYLNFNDGQCETALHFYQKALGGEITSLMRFADAPMPCDDAHKSRVMHAVFVVGKVSFMASDCMPDQPVTKGGQISLALGFDDENEQNQVFEALSDGAVVTLPLGDMFWGARFGMLSDQFGIQWMFNCPKPKVDRL